MNADPTKLRQDQREKTNAELGAVQKGSQAQEFSSAEELIRHDREQTAVPAELAVRLSSALAEERKRSVPWWQRWWKKES